jgi:oligopeptidase B
LLYYYYCLAYKYIHKTKRKNEHHSTANVAKIIPEKLEKHGDVRTDNYYWLNERENPEVIDYLNKENEYYQKSTAHTKQFQDDLFA